MNNALTDPVTGAAHHAGLLWNAVLDGDEYTATGIVLAALGDGVDAETVLLDVIGAVQRRVGREWAANRISVAQEHAATAINERVIGGLVRELPRPRAHRGRITVSCVDGEWHALPARLLSEVLKLRGFGVDYLGAQVPAPHLITHLHRTGPEAVALSGSLPTRLPTAHATISACQAAGVPVIAGGAAFGADGRWARLLGAEAWAPDARAAADRLTTDPLPRPRAAHQPLDDLPHLADQEYTLVTRSSPQLVRAVYAGLEDRVPGMRDYTELQRQYTAEDLAHIVEFLATALYTDDGSLFTAFLTWTADILAARGVPPGSLLPALDLLAGELREFPRATALLTEARAGLARGTDSGGP
ncbi:cobalamin B12-binding domain-containing protein [Amycolatopsis endophytica]|uniref:Methanogenic corrinoid protein MtbC1 n=1 Tax=Amycolatopsis endophytica TaxID=860233 RepID=A0A853BC13_9PSEU|nr:B12-binding domain-containing protein [Amycolatopsis endophytica]NYI92560.1 methanogenic corrinoid protein MtbC1 [Amycolatopsis endophytica]